MSEYFTLQEYRDADCMQMEVPLGTTLYMHTGGRMCEGCPKYRNKCEFLAKLRPLPQTSPTPNPGLSETVREEALRRGLGIKEVRRQRNNIRLSS